MARSIVLIVILLTISNLTGLVTCWNVYITSTKVKIHDTESNPYISVVCQSPGLTHCQVRIYNYMFPKDGNMNIDCSKADWTAFNWTAGKAAHCGTFDNRCETRLYKADVASGRFVVGCRAKNTRADGGWKYNYTTIYYFSDNKNEVCLAPLGKPEIVELGEDATFLCPSHEQTKLLRCIFTLPNKLGNDNVVLNHGLMKNKRPANLDSRYDYYGLGGLKGGDCGIRISNVTEEDNGIVWCRVKINTSGTFNVIAFAVIVAKPPSKATLTFIRDDNNNTVGANCSVAASRPVASIKWLYNGGRVIREDVENELVTDDWFWPWDEQPITQTEKGTLNDENDQMLCLVQHEKSNVQTEKVNGDKYVPLGSWQMKFNPNKPTTQITPHGTADLLCDAGVALKECGFLISAVDSTYYDVSNTSELMEVDKFYKLQNGDTRLTQGVCRLRFTALQVGSSYRIGCRGRAQGGWKYAYTNLDVSDNVLCRLTNFTSNETITLGDNVTLGCVENGEKELKDCTILSATYKEPILATFNLRASGGSARSSGRYSYFHHLDKDGRNKGVCRVQIQNVTETDNGIIKIRAAAGRDTTSRTIYFPVTKPPQEVRLYGADASQYQLGDTLEAYCAVSECRPPATITWYLGGDVIYNNSSDVTIGELLDHEWRWMIDSRRVTQRFKKTIAESDNGKRLSCVVSHVGLKGRLAGQSSTINIQTPNAGMSTGIVIGLSVAILIVIGIMVAIVVYSKIKRIWCFTEQQSAMPSKHKRAANEIPMDDGVPLYAVVNVDTKNNNTSRPRAAGHSGAATEDGAAIYAVVNKDAKKNKKAIPGAAGQAGTSNQKGAARDDGAAIYAVVNKDTKKNKKDIPGRGIEDESVLYSVVNKEPKNKKNAPLGGPNQKGTRKEDESVIYSVVNKESKNKKKAATGTSAAADSGVIYAEIVNTNAGKPAGKPKAALPQENVEYTDLRWN